MNQTNVQSGASDDGPKHRYGAAFANEMEQRRQRAWMDAGVFKAPNPGEISFDPSRPRFYCLDMFPYPSGAGLHIGHPEGYTATDIISRYKRMTGHNVLHPMGWDAFGLPAEQYAIQTGVHPALTTKKAVENFRRQLQRFGFSYDWSREFGTIDPEYYKWTQWIFLRLYNAWFNPWTNRAEPISGLEKGLAEGALVVDMGGEVRSVAGASGLGAVTGLTPGVARWIDLSPERRRALIDSYRLAYLSETVVNWCPKLGTVLANDEVIDGRSERGGYPVLRKPLKQWMLRITAFADRLLHQLEGLDWPESTKTMQREWIGRSEGAEIEFEVRAGSNPEKPRTDISLTVFTTRPDTLFGATFMVVAPEHDLCDAILRGRISVAPDDTARLNDYVNWAKNRGDVERQESKEKSGVFTGAYAVNPVTGGRIPVWAADYVLMGYGTGAIMAVPGGDERDFEFAKKFDLPILRVVDPPAGSKVKPEECFAGEGTATNSSSPELTLDGLPTAAAKKKIIAWLEAKGVGAGKVNYKLRDWTFSRQRYWGEPFPIVYDPRGLPYPIMDSHLPVRLPELADYAPVESEDPQPLLAKARDWMNTTAGAAGVDPGLLPPNTPVTRETNTMPGSAGSSWYAVRYCDPLNHDRLADERAESYWLKGGVDLYMGGSEHAVGHLLYSRFWHNVLFDLGYLASPEPFKKLFHQGLITSYAYQRDDKTIVPVDEVKEVSEGRYAETATGKVVTPIVTKMSKRYKNVVNPDDVIAEFGADTCRLYEMYMGPLEASKPWNPRDITGLFRFLQRLWRVCIDENSGRPRIASDRNEDLERQLHRLIKRVGDDIERISLNTAIAAMIEFVNAAVAAGAAGSGAGPGVLTDDQINRLMLVVSPFAPHIADEVRDRIGHTNPALLERWPRVDPAMLKDSSVEVPVSLLGKVRHRITVAVEIAADAKSLESAALADAKVIELIGGRAIKKVIVVPGKMVNIVHG